MEDIYSEDSEFKQIPIDNTLNFGKKFPQPSKILPGPSFINTERSNPRVPGYNNNHNNSQYPTLPIVTSRFNHGPATAVEGQGSAGPISKPGSRALMALNHVRNGHQNNQNPGKKNFLLSFLNQYRAGDDGIFTHTSIGSPVGSFNIPEDKMSTLYDLVEKNIAHGIPTYLTEKPQNPCAIKIDLDFRFDYEETNRLYTWEHIAGTINVYNEA